MSRRALVIGAGQIGSAIAERLMDSGWQVGLVTRGRRPLLPSLADRADAIVADRAVAGSLADAIGRGADAVIDTIAYEPDDAGPLLARRGDIGACVIISSASVYADDQGRSLDRSQGRGFPDLSEPVTEAQSTVPPGPATYASRKRALEIRMLDAGARTTIIRPCAVHGPESRDPREWWFVKRLLDGRRVIPLAFDGTSRFHPSGTRNLAGVVEAALTAPADRILNAVDPDCPAVADIGRAIMAAIGRTAELVGLPGERPDHVGTTPWSVPGPFVLSDAAARSLVYAPLADYAAGVGPACRWLLDHVPADDWQTTLTGLAKYPYDLFDYAAEDRWLAAH